MVAPTAFIPVRWRLSSLAETPASACVSAACYGRSEDIDVLTMVVAELEFRDVQRQILLADLVIGADNAALEDAPESLNRVGMDGTNDVFTLRVLDDFVRVQLLDVVIANPFVSHEQADLAVYCVHDELGKQFAAHRINDARYDVPFAAHSADNGRLAGANTATAGTTPSIAPMLVLGFAADEGFVHLNDPAQLVEVLFDERGADAMAHIPSRLIGAETEVAMDLACAHSLFAGQQKVDDLKPASQIDIGVLEDRSCDVGEPIAAGAAIGALPFELHSLEFVRPIRAAARATDAIWPAARHQIGVAGFFIRKHLLKLAYGQLGDLFRLLCAGHDGSPYRQGGVCHV